MNKLLHSFFLLILLFPLKDLVAQKSLIKQNIPVNGSSNLINNSDSVQYALGAYVAKWMFENGFTIKNPNLFQAGLSDMLKDGKNKKLSDSLITALVSSSQQLNQKEKGSRQEQLLFTSLKDKPNIGMLPNGVRYAIIKQGIGKHAIETDTLVLNILAKLPDNSIIENTYENKQPVFNTPYNFFPGLKEALMMMPEGSKWQVFIPSKLAFGEKGSPPRIPPNSALIIEVEILSIKK